MKEHLKTDSPRLGETDSFPIDAHRLLKMTWNQNLSHDAQKLQLFIVFRLHMNFFTRMISDRFKRSENILIPDFSFL